MFERLNIDSNRQLTKTFIYTNLLINLKGLNILSIRTIFKNDKFNEDKLQSSNEKITIKKSSFDHVSDK